MSYQTNGLNGPSNGYRGQPPRSRDGDDPRRNRRAGDYRGFNYDEDARKREEDRLAPNPNQQLPYSARPVPAWRRQHSDEIEAKARRESGAGAKSYGDGPGARLIEGVVQHINERWSVMTSDDCVPVHIALQLMDYSSLGRGNDYKDFQQTSKSLQRALKTIVNEHHQGFNSSIGTFHKIQASIQTSQDRVRTLRSSLIDAKSNLAPSKPEIRGLATTSQNYDEMLQTLTQIERVQSLPEQLDARISDKHFLTAVEVLQEALRLIRHSSLESISALADLQLYFSNQESSLTDILLEELHDHLYLKSAYCQNRWKPPTSNGDIREPEQQLDDMSTGIRPLYRFLTGLNAALPVSDDSTRNPEEDSFEYMRMIIESLNRMGRLDLVVNRVEQRLPIELFAVVERTNQEVDQRHPAHLRAIPTGIAISAYSNANIAGGGDVVLNDLLHTLYAKFEAIAEGHRAVHEVISGIVEREGIRNKDILTGGFKELWKLLQSEMRSLLHDYLATDDNNGLHSSRDASKGVTNIFQRQPRDKHKRVFKLGEMDKKATNLASEQEELDKILQASVPGLVSKQHDQADLARTQRVVNFESTSAGHKLLVEASVFNIGILLPPSLSFLQRLKEIVPPDSDIAISTLTSFLDDFLVNVFNPQLDETVTELCAQCFITSDAYQQDPRWADRSQSPIFKGASQFFTLIKAFCRMLSNVPQDQAFTQLIITQLKTYHSQCQTQYKSLVMRAREDGGVESKPAAAVLEQSDLAVVVRTIWRAEGLDHERLMDQEVDMIVTRTRERPMEVFDLISDRKTGPALCLMYSSMQWLAHQLEELKHVVQKHRSSVQDAKQMTKPNRWLAVESTSLRDQEQPVWLPMTAGDAVGAFDAVLDALRELAKVALFTLHVDIRFGISFMVARTMEEAYVLDQPLPQPDPAVLRLNADLLGFDDAMTAHLPAREYRFMVEGLGRLIDRQIVTKAPNIAAMNQHGCARMQLNILVLQQNLRGIERDVLLEKSALFFDYFHGGPKAVIQKAKDAGGKDMGLDLEEMKILLNLYYSEGLNSPHREVAAQAKRAMGEDMLQLTEYMWSA